MELLCSTKVSHGKERSPYPLRDALRSDGHSVPMPKGHAKSDRAQRNAQRAIALYPPCKKGKACLPLFLKLQVELS
ncbi:MAG: hypothetical protein KME57_16125 [Scytonema hyalinum WJT4-NPBG1]|nr:hypothetical protein [Scytonema hyalinum WJT4-NPBG1]